MATFIPRRLKGRLVRIGPIVLGLAISLGLGWLAINGLEWGQVGDSFKKLPLHMGLLAFLTFLAAGLVRAIRLKVLFVGDSPSVPRLFVIQNVGIGLNNLSPVRVISEPAQFTILTVREGIKGGIAAAVLGLERVIDVIVSTLLFSIFFFFIPEIRDFKISILGVLEVSGWMIFAGVLTITAFVLIMVRFTAWSSEGLSFVKRIPFLAALTSAVALLEKQPVRLMASTIITVGFTLLIGLTVWIVAQGMGIDVSFITATVIIMAITSFVLLVPAAPGALGTFEWSVVYVLGFFGLAEKDGAFSFAIIIHALLFVPPTIMALIFLPGEGIGSLRRFRSMVNRVVRESEEAQSQA